MSRSRTLATMSTTEAEDPRVARTRAACLEAVRSLLRDEGPSAVTHQRVAERAGVGRATVYRHWPQPSDLLVEAIDTYRREPRPDVLTGNLHADVLAWLRTLRELLADPFAPHMVALVARSEWDEQIRTVKQHVLARGTAGLRTVLAEAAGHDAINRDADLDLAIARLVGPLFFQRFFANVDITDDALVAVTDGVLASLGATRS